MRRLRAYGIYKLPGVSRPVFVVPAGGGYLLYDSLLGEEMPSRFEVTPEGRVTNWHGDRIEVSVEEFEDTGETYAPRARRGRRVAGRTRRREAASNSFRRAASYRLCFRPTRFRQGGVMRRVLLGCALFITSAAAHAQAQGPTLDRPPMPNGERMSSDDVQPYSHSLTGKVAEIADGGKAVVLRLADGTRSKYLINEKTRLRADKETPLAGRRDLTLADYQPGQTVTLTPRNSDLRVLEVRLRRAKD